MISGSAGWHAFGNVPEEGFSLLAEGRCLVEPERRRKAETLTEARALFKRLDAAHYVAEAGELAAGSALTKS